MENTQTVSVLTGEKVTVKPIRRLSDWLPEGHDSEFMNDGASWSLCVPTYANKKALVDPLSDLTSTQKGDLAEKLGLESSAEFNVYRSENYWKNFEVKIDRNGRQLDLTDPYDYIIYRVLQCNTTWIAPTFEMRNMKQTYKFALEHETDKMNTEVTLVNKKERSYLALSKISSSKDMMSNFMWAHYLQVKAAQRPPIEAPNDWLKTEIGKIIEHDADVFLKIVEDEGYPYKVLIMKAMNVGALARVGDQYMFPGAERPIGSLEQMVNHLMDERYQGDLLKLKTQVEIAQKETLDKKISAVNMDDIAPRIKTGEEIPLPDNGEEIPLPDNIETVREGDDIDTGPSILRNEYGNPETDPDKLEEHWRKQDEGDGTEPENIE
jgi:hypothetical protein